MSGAGYFLLTAEEETIWNLINIIYFKFIINIKFLLNLYIFLVISIKRLV